MQAVVVGAGQAGARAAVAMREAGFAGRVLLVGEEGHHPYERPPLSKQVLSGEAAVLPRLVEGRRYADLDLKVMMRTRVAEIDAAAARVLLSNGRSVPFDKLVLATGGRARRLCVPGAHHLLALRTFDHALHLRERIRASRSVLCIGAGVVGLEIASSARALGCEVTVVELGSEVMGRCLSPEGRAFVQELHRRAGVELRFNLATLSVAQSDGRYMVDLSDGSRVVADCVVVGIGMDRNTEIAVAAGIDVDNGVVVDAFGRSSHPEVFARGEVAAFWHPRLRRHVRLESWAHAQNHGIAVRRAVAGRSEPYDEVPWFWTEQHGVRVQVAGFPGDASRTLERPTNRPDGFCAFHLDGAGSVVGVTVANDARAFKVGRLLIRSGVAADPAALADPAVSLRSLRSAAHD